MSRAARSVPRSRARRSCPCGSWPASAPASPAGSLCRTRGNGLGVLCLAGGASLLGLHGSGRTGGAGAGLVRAWRSPPDARSSGCAPSGSRRRGSNGRGSSRSTARVERVETLAAKGDLRLTLAPLDAGLPPRVRVSAPDSEERARALPKAPSSPCARGCRRRRRWRCPDGHDFARDAWFRGIGGSRPGARADRAEGAGGGERPRRASRTGSAGISAARLPERSGGIATALATGDQNAVGEEDAEAMRRSGLTHLLSVSGLHIAAVVGGGDAADSEAAGA